VETASARKTKTGVEIEIAFTEAGRKKFAGITKDNVGRVLGIVVGGRLISAPVIRTWIPVGRASIVGSFSLEEAERVAKGIRGE
jgi:preprotein translocase subunit SecD